MLQVFQTRGTLTQPWWRRAYRGYTGPNGVVLGIDQDEDAIQTFRKNSRQDQNKQLILFIREF